FRRVLFRSGGDELLDELASRDDDLSAQMATFLRGGKLVLEMNAGCAGFDHRLRDLECMERPAESGLRVRDDRREPVAVVRAAHVRFLVFPSECVVDPRSEEHTSELQSLAYLVCR